MDAMKALVNVNCRSSDVFIVTKLILTKSYIYGKKKKDSRETKSRLYVWSLYMLTFNLLCLQMWPKWETAGFIGMTFWFSHSTLGDILLQEHPIHSGWEDLLETF